MTGPSKFFRLGFQMLPIRMHRQEPRMRLSPSAEAEMRLYLSQIAPYRLPVGSFSRGSVWHRSGEAA